MCCYFPFLSLIPLLPPFLPSSPFFLRYKYAPSLDGGGSSTGSGDGSGESGEAECAKALLANANRGGENVATGALIGALIGAGENHLK